MADQTEQTVPFLKSSEARTAQGSAPAHAAAPFRLSHFGRWMGAAIVAGVAVWGLVIYLVLRMIG